MPDEVRTVAHFRRSIPLVRRIYPIIEITERQLEEMRRQIDVELFSEEEIWIDPRNWALIMDEHLSSFQRFRGLGFSDTLSRRLVRQLDRIIDAENWGFSIEEVRHLNQEFDRLYALESENGNPPFYRRDSDPSFYRHGL